VASQQLHHQQAQHPAAAMQTAPSTASSGVLPAPSTQHSGQLAHADSVGVRSLLYLRVIRSRHCTLDQFDFAAKHAFTMTGWQYATIAHHSTADRGRRSSTSLEL